ncbi:hypothetical protein [Hymenobacter norwichensis]|uniref:hypothetical protein n=1 Tax=Hymenobacter norwichensis TaxID=223903 RepID=UPI0003B513BF|nr:hypothetical protein [Hymenobacter norwichensis]
MSRLLLLGLSLLIVACKKEDPQADPSLLGRWESQQSNDFEYSATGQLISQVNRPDMTYYMVITADSLNYYGRRDGSSWGEHTYVRQGDQITYGTTQVKCTITELSEHTLTLRFKNINKSAPNTPYTDAEEHYTR